MLTVKCSKCATALKLKAAPPSGKVKCPKCATILAVGSPAQPGKTAASAGRPNPSRGNASRGNIPQPDVDQFDFGKLDFPTAAAAPAVTQFAESGSRQAYTGPIPGDPLANADDGQSEASANSNSGGSAGPKKSGKSVWFWIRLAVGLILLVVCTAVAVLVWSQRADRIKAKQDAADAAAAAEVVDPDANP